MQLKEGVQPGPKKSTVQIVFGILILLRIMLSSRLPAYMMVNMPHDDGWLVRQANFILMGSWLGPYDQITLIKGPFAPLFMAAAAQIGVSFSSLNTLLYCLSCVLFIYAVRPLIKNQWFQVISFAILLFNPLTYALETGQRIYRNSMGQWQILIIFACLIALFLRRKESAKSLLKWGVLGGLALGAFFGTREDSAWIYPFVLGTIGTTILAYLLEKVGPKRKIWVYLVPLVIAYSMGGLFALKNKEVYGAAIVNDRSGGNYAKVAGDLYAITPDAKDDLLYNSEKYRDRYITLYVSTIEKAIAASPTLNQIAGPFRESIKWWADLINPGIGQPFSDHMLFALRDGARAAGYYKSLPETEAFYGKVHEELKAAFENGTLIKHGFSISPLIKRVQWSDFGKAFGVFPGAVANIVSFRDVHSAAYPAGGSDPAIEKFAVTAGGEYFKPFKGINGRGWAFLEGDKESLLRAGLYDKEGTVIFPFTLEVGDYAVEAFQFPSVKVSRFSFDVKGYDHTSGATFRFFNQKNELVGQVPVDGGPHCGVKEGGFHYCILEEMVNHVSPAVYYSSQTDRANKVIDVYKHLGPVFGILALLLYLVATTKVIQEVITKRELATLPVWLVLTGSGLTFTLFVFAMCLITAVSFNSLIYLYLAPAYALFLMFWVVSVSWGLQTFRDFRKNRHV
jgi:hypothetical protein